jgi:GTPase SAR1 family protein
MFGPSNAGSSSLRKATMENLPFAAVENIPPTRGIERETYLFRGVLEISAWDAAGQKKYQERYYGSQEENVFSAVDLPIYMLDANVVDDAVRPDFDKFVNKIIERNPQINMIYVFINKIDLPDARAAEVLELLIKNLPSQTYKKLCIMPVSVKHGSAQKKLIEICDKFIKDRVEVMEKLDKLRSILETFKNAAGGSDFILFHERDGLMMASTFGDFTTQALQFLTFRSSTLSDLLQPSTGSRACQQFMRRSWNCEIKR